MFVLSHLFLDILRLQLFRYYRLWLYFDPSLLFFGLPLLMKLFSPPLPVSIGNRHAVGEIQVGGQEERGSSPLHHLDCTAEGLILRFHLILIGTKTPSF